jgi:hypothetical protein
VEDTNVPDGNALADKVKINLNMLGALVMNGVGGEVDDADIVTVDQSDPRQGAMKLHKQLSKPTRRCHAIWYSASSLEQETTFWRFENHEMRLSPRNTA